MRRAAGLSPEPGKRSQMSSRDPRPPKASGRPWPSPPPRLASGGSRAPPAQGRRVIFEDEVVPLGRPPGRVPTTKEGVKLGSGSTSSRSTSSRSISPRLAPRPHAVPDYVVKYPVIQSPRQREGYKGVFQDQLAEYTELLGEVHAARRRFGELEVASSRMDLALLEKEQRCQYLKKKLTHIKARIREYDRGVYF